MKKRPEPAKAKENKDKKIQKASKTVKNSNNDDIQSPVVKLET